MLAKSFSHCNLARVLHFVKALKVPQRGRPTMDLSFCPIYSEVRLVFSPRVIGHFGRQGQRRGQQSREIRLHHRHQTLPILKVRVSLVPRHGRKEANGRTAPPEGTRNRSDELFGPLAFLANTTATANDPFNECESSSSNKFGSIRKEESNRFLLFQLPVLVRVRATNKL